MAPKWRVTFAVTRDDSTIDSFDCTIGKLSKYIGQVGSLDLTIPIPNEDVGRRLQPIIGGEGRLSMYAYKDEQLWWGGFVDKTTVTGGIDGASLAVSGATFEAYLDRRESREDYQLTGSFATNGIDQINYATLVWRSVQGGSHNENIRVNVLDQPLTGKNIALSWLRSDTRTFGSILTEASNRTDGFEWVIDVSDNNGVRQRDLKTGYPIIGRPDSGLVFSYPGAITSYTIDGDALDGANAFQAKGKAPTPVGTPTPKKWQYDPETQTAVLVDVPVANGQAAPAEPSMSTQEYFSDAHFQAGYTRMDTTVTRSTETDVNVLNAWAQLGRDMRSGPLVLPSINCHLDSLDQAVLGCTILLRIDDYPYPRKPDGAPGWEGSARVIGYEVDPGEYGVVDTVSVIFENPHDQEHQNMSPEGTLYYPKVKAI